MRFVIRIVAALMILGLATFGVVSAQKMSAAPSQATASDSASALAAPVAVRRHPVNPVAQLAQGGAGSVLATPAAPMRVAQATQGTDPAAPAAMPFRHAINPAAWGSHASLRSIRPAVRSVSAIPAIRLPTRQGSGSDFRRRSLARQHAGRAQGAG